MTDEQATQMIELLKAIDYKLWKFFEREGFDKQVLTETAPKPQASVSKALYDQFVRNKRS